MCRGGRSAGLLGGDERGFSPSACLLAIVSAQRSGERTGIKLGDCLELLVT
jgi:hypothetical protein